MRIYDTFCQTVSDAVNNATKQEKAAIRQELMEHLEDHAADLIEAQGLSEEDAAQAAIAAMGDPAEIGQALNEKYPAWPEEAASILNALILLLCVLLFYSLYVNTPLPVGNLTARLAPERAFSYPEEAFQNAGEADYRWTLNGQVYRVYRISRTTNDSMEPIVQIWICTYNENPFLSAAYDSLHCLQFHGESETDRWFFCRGAQGKRGAGYSMYEVPVNAVDAWLTVYLGSCGSGFSADIPIPESEVQP